MEVVIMDEDSRTKRAVTQRFVKGLGIGGLAIVAFLGLAGRVRAGLTPTNCTIVD